MIIIPSTSRRSDSVNVAIAGKSGVCTVWLAPAIADEGGLLAAAKLIRPLLGQRFVSVYVGLTVR